MKAKKVECGAKTRAGGSCKAPAMGNGRCKLHGGLNPGAPVENGNAIKHGIYGDLIREDDLPFIDDVRSAVGKVDEEILMARLQLRRALRAQAKADTIEDGLEIDERIEREGGGEAVAARNEEKYKRRDYIAIINSIMARIESLEKTRLALVAGASSGSDDSLTREDTFIAPDEPIPDAPIL